MYSPSRPSKLTETLEITRLLQCDCIKFDLLLKKCGCVLIISLYRERFYVRSPKEHRYIEKRYIGVLFHTFYCNLCWDIPGTSLYRGSLYRGSTLTGIDGFGL